MSGLQIRTSYVANELPKHALIPRSGYTSITPGVACGTGGLKDGQCSSPERGCTLGCFTSENDI